MIRFKLKSYLASIGVTQTVLQERTGIRRATLVDLNQGTSKQIPVYVLDRICSALSCTISDIIEYVPDSSD